MLDTLQILINAYEHIQLYMNHKYIYIYTNILFVYGHKKNNDSPVIKRGNEESPTDANFFMDKSSIKWVDFPQHHV